MKTIFRTLTAALLLACTAAVAQNSKPFTIPEVKTWKAGNGTLTLTPQSRIVCTAGDAAYKQVASQLADDYALISGTRLSVVTDGKGRDGDIVLRSGGNRKQAESYRMAVGRNVTITADDIAGLTGTIGYEIVCSVSERVPRVAVRNGKRLGIYKL